jgi:isopenicillin N synthase-like dioxygenase
MRASKCGGRLVQNIPTIDISRQGAGGLTPRDSADLAAACEDHGFFLLAGHGSDDLITRTFHASRRFFALPRAVKRSVVRTEENPLGYFDRELTKQKRDQKEVFDFKAGGHRSRKPNRRQRWPENEGAFKATLIEFFAVFTDLSEQTMTMIFAALGMPGPRIAATMASSFGAEHTSAARLNYYPADDPVPSSERGDINPLGDMALHHHTDPGAITLLLQDDHGGLQARSKTDGWIDVPPEPGTIVVNVGDVMQVWTNDRCTAGVHRVRPVDSADGRYSTPFFYQPRFDAVVEPWVGEGETRHYRPFAWREFIRGRVADNFADYGEDDIQVEKYRVA